MEGCVAKATPAIAGRRWLCLDDQLRRAAGLTEMLVGSATVSPPPEKNSSVIVSARSSARPVKVATPFRDRRGCPDERAGTGGELGRDHRAAVAGLEVTEPVLLLDHRLDAQRLAGRRASTSSCASTINWLAPAGLTLMLPEGPAVNPPPEKSSEIVSAMSS